MSLEEKERLEREILRLQTRSKLMQDQIDGLRMESDIRSQVQLEISKERLSKPGIVSDQLGKGIFKYLLEIIKYLVVAVLILLGSEHFPR